MVDLLPIAKTMVSCSDFGHLTSVGLLNLKEAKRRTEEPKKRFWGNKALQQKEITVKKMREKYRPEMFHVNIAPGFSCAVTYC